MRSPSEDSLTINLLHLGAIALRLLELVGDVPETAIHGLICLLTDRHGVVLVILLLEVCLWMALVSAQGERLHLLLGNGLHLCLHIGLGTLHSQHGLLFLVLLGSLCNHDALPLVLPGYRLRSPCQKVDGGALAL